MSDIRTFTVTSQYNYIDTISIEGKCPQNFKLSYTMRNHNQLQKKNIETYFKKINDHTKIQAT